VVSKQRLVDVQIGIGETAERDVQRLPGFPARLPPRESAASMRVRNPLLSTGRPKTIHLFVRRVTDTKDMPLPAERSAPAPVLLQQMVLAHPAAHFVGMHLALTHQQ
jgi:hypothetical protein